MRDYWYTPDDAPRCLVAQMRTDDIHDILAANDCIITDYDGPVPPKEAVMERLRLELFIRELCLRGE